jgi:hypothetical protein
MAGDIDKTIQENLNFTMAAGHDSHDAFIKAIGTLAQVIYMITPDAIRGMIDAMLYILGKEDPGEKPTKKAKAR